MADKVIHEVKFIETDDGYRVEINGDKEQLKKMFDKGRGFGPMGFFSHKMRHASWGRGPWAINAALGLPGRGTCRTKRSTNTTALRSSRS